MNYYLMFLCESINVRIIRELHQLAKFNSAYLIGDESRSDSLSTHNKGILMTEYTLQSRNISDSMPYLLWNPAAQSDRSLVSTSIVASTGAFPEKSMTNMLRQLTPARFQRSRIIPSPEDQSLDKLFSTTALHRYHVPTTNTSDEKTATYTGYGHKWKCEVSSSFMVSDSGANIAARKYSRWFVNVVLPSGPNLGPYPDGWRQRSTGCQGQNVVAGKTCYLLKSAVSAVVAAWCHIRAL